MLQTIFLVYNQKDGSLMHLRLQFVEPCHLVRDKST
jgi:hypothetical protein